MRDLRRGAKGCQVSRVSCMGGWCGVRDKCALHVTNDRSKPAERMCRKGDTESFEPIRVIRACVAGEHTPAAPATWFDPATSFSTA